MDSRLLIGGGVAVAALLLSRRASAQQITPTGTPAEGFVGLQKDDDGPEVKKRKITRVEDLIPSEPGSVWDSSGMTIKLEHPLAATNSSYNRYYFNAKLVVDVLQSGAYESWAEVPESIQGDYVWELTRHGDTQSGSWTVNETANDIRGSLSKSILMQSVDAIKPTWELVLGQFGGFTPNYPAANEGSVTIQNGYFTDTGGRWRYVDSNGSAVNSQNVMLDLNGNPLSPEPLTMQVKCQGSNSWTNYGSPITVVGSLIGESGGNKFFPADAETGYLPSGLPYGCTIPINTKTLPSTIRVIEDNGDYTNYTQVSIDDLIVSGTQVSVVDNQSASTDEAVIYYKLFNSFNFPLVHKDASGYYVRNNWRNNQKAYISTLIPGFGAYYARRQVQCTCPNGTVNAGQTVTVYDTNNCPSWTSFISTSDKNNYCGGDAPTPEPVDKGECICTTNVFSGQTSCKYENVDETCTLQQAPSQEEGSDNEEYADLITDSGDNSGWINFVPSAAEQNNMITSFQSYINW